MMKIAVIGAGMGGLAATTLLAAQGHETQLFERFSQPKPIGSGLVVQPVGLAVLDHLGAGTEARRLGAPLARMQGFAGKRQVLNVSYRKTAPGLAIHRAALFHSLWSAMAREGGTTVTTGAEVTSAPLGRHGRQVCLADGRAFGPFDLVVDTSGSHSALSPLVARALPYGAVWGHVPWPADSPLARDQLSQRYQGAQKMAGILPIGCLPDDPQPRAAVFWSLPAALLDRWPDQDMATWRAEVSALFPEMAAFVAPLTDAAQMTTARYSHGTLADPCAEGLVFLGDAAHRASPQLGQGANMALLDAMALSLALQSGAPLQDALRLYAKMRRWHVRTYQSMSAAFTPMYQSASHLLPRLRDWVLAPASAIPPMPRLLTALVAGDMIPPIAGTQFP
jgi:2-polyprenyl-6-methoxyphenol hydroxylase-like FAD-dependent oxidoreductase